MISLGRTSFFYVFLQFPGFPKFPPSHCGFYGHEML